MMQQTTASSIDPAAFERLRKDVGRENTAFLRELIGDYLSSAAALIADLQDAVHAEDADALERAAHTLKGSSAHMGATVLRAHCAEIEHCAGEGAFEEAERHIAAVSAEFERVEQALDKRRAEL